VPRSKRSRTPSTAELTTGTTRTMHSGLPKSRRSRAPPAAGGVPNSPDRP